MKLQSSDGFIDRRLSAPGFVDKESIKTLTPLHTIRMNAMFGIWPKLEHLQLFVLEDIVHIGFSKPVYGDSKIFQDHIVQRAIRTLTLDFPMALLRNILVFQSSSRLLVVWSLILKRFQAWNQSHLANWVVRVMCLIPTISKGLRAFLSSI